MKIRLIDDAQRANELADKISELYRNRYFSNFIDDLHRVARNIQMCQEVSLKDIQDLQEAYKECVAFKDGINEVLAEVGHAV